MANTNKARLRFYADFTYQLTANEADELQSVIGPDGNPLAVMDFELSITEEAGTPLDLQIARIQITLDSAIEGSVDMDTKFTAETVKDITDYLVQQNSDLDMWEYPNTATIEVKEAV